MKEMEDQSSSLQCEQFPCVGSSKVKWQTHSFNNSGWAYKIVLLPETEGRAALALAKFVYTMASNPSGAGCMREKWVADSGFLLETQTDPRPPGQTPSKTPSMPGCLVPDSGTQGCTLTLVRAACPRTTIGCGAPICKGGMTTDIGNHCCVVCPDKHMIPTEVWKKIFQSQKNSHHLQAIYVPREIAIL